MGKYLRKTKVKKNIPIRVAAVLLYLTLVTTYIVSGLFARYTASSEAGDQARVAKFSVWGNDKFSQTIEAEFVPGSTQTVDLVIHNSSEVAVEYTLTVGNETGNLPLELTMTKTEAGAGADSTQTTSGINSVIFTEKWLPGSHTDSYLLTIDWKATDKKADWMGKVDYITATVTATQID